MTAHYEQLAALRMREDQERAARMRVCAKYNRQRRWTRVAEFAARRAQQ